MASVGTLEQALVAPDELEVRRALGHFPTGVTIVSFERGGRVHGLTASSFVSLSLRPPLIMVAVAKSARSHDLLPGCPFTVNVLRPQQELLAARFARDDEDEARERTVWQANAMGPRLPDALAHIGCVPWSRSDAGDHTMFVGRVVAVDGADGPALGFFRSRFVSVGEPAAQEPVANLDPRDDPYELPPDAI